MKPKVAIVRCRDYNPLNLYQAISEAIDLIGGFSLFINKGDKVLLKPNLLAARSPETAVDTHPEVVRAVIRLTQEAGGIPLVGDSPGGCIKVEEVYEISGIKKICKEESVRLIKFERLKEIDGVPVAREALEVDKIISIPKFKTHSLTLITGAIKNVFGVVPGIFKSECHRLHPHVKDFTKLLVNIFSLLHPSVSIMDGIVAMEGNGPASGEIRDLGLIITSSDAIALDSVASSIVGLNPLDVPTTQEAYIRGLGEARLERIEVVGESLEGVKVKDFRLPKTSILSYLPCSLLNILSHLIQFRPKINRNKCKQCNLCFNSCPVRAIEPCSYGYRIDYHRCILCLCCNEVCPYQAVFISKGPLAKIFGV
jgi:uncharacterized protein (DUF362 family)/Pyruvate/2-oxoacid:ferredoxin oxidoreductase delta subunit